jgi:hypothetical protein
MSRWVGEPGARVQWAQGSGSGARSWGYHGIGKVHVMGAAGRTLCGRLPKWRNAWRATDEDVRRQGACQRCARAAA